MMIYKADLSTMKLSKRKPLQLQITLLKVEVLNLVGQSVLPLTVFVYFAVP
jgi:hypothetical protein